MAAGLLAATIAGCGGGGDAAPAAGSGGSTTTATGAPAGTAVLTAAAAAAATGTATTASNPAQAFGLITAAGGAVATIQSPPVVNFTVIDSAGKFVPGLKLIVDAGKADPACTTSTTSTAGHVTFAMAKWDASSGWRSLISRQRTDVNTTTPAVKYAVAEGTADPKPTTTLTNPATAVSDPSTRVVGILEENTAGGYYTYRFATDVVTPLLLQDAVAGRSIAASAATATAPAYSNRVANNGNVVVKDGQSVYRIGVQLCYTDPASSAKVVVNPTVDFTVGADGVAVPVKAADGKTLAPYRKVVAMESCNECHSALKVHGTRVDPNYCVICHNAGSTDYNTNNPIDMKVMVHKIHAGEKIHEWFGQTYKVASVDFSEVTYPQPLTNCTKCHDGAKTSQGDNWKNVPTRTGCGACHSGINWATGKGPTIANAEADLLAGSALGTTSTGHIGGSKADDTQCVLCHGAADIPVYHVTVDPKLSAANSRAYYKGKAPAAAAQMNLPEGVYKIDLEIKQVTVTGAAGAKKANVVYRIMKDGAPVTLNATGFLINNVDGTPTIQVNYAVAQDGIATPADWNASTSASVTAVRDGNFQTGPDASGYYTATLPTSATAFIPDAATMVTASLGINYAGLIQTNLSSYPDGILLREPKFAMKTADGFSARRAIVSADKCNNCHGQLGIAPTFHGGARNNGEGCAICHDANRATGHVGPTYSFGGGWSVASKNMVHAIHGSSKRANAFTYEATAANPNGFKKVTYPGILKNCEQCHVAGSYDFSGAENKAALPNLLWTTDTKGNMLNDATTNPTSIASIGLSPWVTTNGSGQINYTADNLVSSPIASSCFGCHDSSTAVAHMEGNGGTLVRLFSSVASVAARPAIGTTSTMTFTKKELCMDCHVSTSTYGLGIKAVHAK